MTTEQKTEVTGIKGLAVKYQELANQIPLKSLEELPIKLKKFSGILGISAVESLDFATPVRQILGFVAEMIKEMHALDKRIKKLEKRLPPE